MENIKISKAVADDVARIKRRVRREIEETFRERGRLAIKKARDDAHAAVMVVLDGAELDRAAYLKADKEGELAISAAQAAAEKEITDILAALDSVDYLVGCDVFVLFAAAENRRAYEVADQVKGKQYLREAGVVVDGPVVEAEVREQVERVAMAAARKVYLTAMKERRD